MTPKDPILVRLPMLYDRRVQAAISIVEQNLTPPAGTTQARFNVQLVIALVDQMAAVQRLLGKT